MSHWHSNKADVAKRHWLDMKLSECAARNWFAFPLCWPCLLKIFLSGTFKLHQQPLCTTVQLPSHCIIRRNNTSLHVNYTLRALYQCLYFVFRLMAV
jgi:hypothetical protein